jgi:multidrug efflux system outer membrane protein
MFHKTTLKAKQQSRNTTVRTKQNFSLLLLVIFITLPGCSITPQPFTPAELQQQAKEDLKVIFTDQEPLSGKVTLYDAMARAIKYNLEHKVKLFENALAKGVLVQSQKDLLPQLVSSAGYTTRNNYNASYSENISVGTQTTYTDLAISEEKQNFSSDLIFVWNILDFGVGYNQAKQQADQVLIAEEQRRKTAQNIAQDVRYAFWRAVSAEKLLPKMDLLLKQV